MLDSRTFDASQSKQLQLLRLTIALAITARIGEGTVATEDADVFARQLSEAATEINRAAIDAGYPSWNGTSLKYPCLVGLGQMRPNENPGRGPAFPISFDTQHETNGVRIEQSGYLAADAACPGYYVDFEVNISRIESRIVRALLTSLPTDRARKFIEDLSSGSVFSALLSLARSTGDIAGAFHRGAGAYRTGLETVAASTETCDYDPTHVPPNDRDFDQRYDTVLTAASCLGLSGVDLFDREDIEAKNLPNQVHPTAFMAVFRIVRAACVELPLENFAVNDAGQFLRQRENRAEACDYLYFNPAVRPSTITLPDAAGAVGDQQGGNGSAPINPP